MILLQAFEFKHESDKLNCLLDPLSEARFAERTQFKYWSFDDILQHLHFWNRAADLSLGDPAAFSELLGSLQRWLASGTLRRFEAEQLGDIKGRALLLAWRQFYSGMSERFAAAEPAARVQWAGPDMSVRSSITARLMETWAHGQAIYDRLGIEREEDDGIRNIVVLGVNTFGWAFRNRDLEVPERAPYLRLDAPSGAVWKFNDPNDENRIEGRATEFCQVVTQVRNIADTALRVDGEVATQWMAIAQCFAGPAQDPPPPGTRFRQS